ncbi:MAG: universal stress protein, partial [Rhodospirillales bacterium]|nr:universal stress protein [Rhodospirillales bacterium]
MTDLAAHTEHEMDATQAHHGPVLCAVDFSADSRIALKWANTIASSLETGLLVLHVIHDPLDSPGYYKQEEGQHLRPMEDVAESMMREFIIDELGLDPADNKPDHVQTMLVVGVPV